MAYTIQGGAQSDYYHSNADQPTTTTIPDLISGTVDEPFTSASSPPSPPSPPPPRMSIGQVLREFWDELKSLVLELIQYGRHKCWKKKVLTVCLFLSSVLVFTDLIFFGYIVSWLEEFVMWMTYHSITAVFAFICIFVLSTREYTTTIYYYYGVLLYSTVLW
jgi:hypothetical protein